MQFKTNKDLKQQDKRLGQIINRCIRQLQTKRVLGGTKRQAKEIQ